MTVEQEHSCLLSQPFPGNIEDIKIMTSSHLGIEPTQKRMLDWYSHLNVVSIQAMLRNETSSPHTFGEAISVFYIFCHKKIEVMKRLAKLLHHQVRKMLR